jgi:hypothetical protein
MSSRNLHVQNFKTLLKKFTCNNLIEFAQLNFLDGDIQTSIRNMNGDVIVKAKVPNNVISGINPNEELTMNFVEIPIRVSPHLDVLDDDATPILISDDRINILSGDSHRDSCLTFSDDSVVEDFIMHRDAADGIEPFYSMPVTDHFVDVEFDKIKKVAARFNKVYFTVEDEVLYIETTDKTNLFADSYKVDIESLPGVEDMTICYDLRNISALMQIIEEEENKNFTMMFYWLEESDRGMIYASSEDESEKYFLLSREI